MENNELLRLVQSVSRVKYATIPSYNIMDIGNRNSSISMSVTRFSQKRTNNTLTLTGVCAFVQNLSELNQEPS